MLRNRPTVLCCVVQRRELIGAVDFSQRQQKFAREQDVLEGSQDVTASLRRTRQLMMQNLEQTHGNISVLGTLNQLYLQDSSNSSREVSGRQLQGWGLVLASC